MTKKLIENNESIAVKSESESTDTKQKIHNWMPKWEKEEECFKKAVVRDVNTKKIDKGGGLRWWNKPTDQTAYENWLSAVVNQETGNFYPERDEEGVPIKGTGARELVYVITRLRDTKGNEFLLSKGKLIGFDAGGTKKQYPISYGEKWHKTVFSYQRKWDENTGVKIVGTDGPSPESHDVYDLPFSAENIKKLFEKVEDNNCQFYIKDLYTGEARDVRNREHRIDPSTIKERLDLFTNQSFDTLLKATYLPAPVKMELRQEAVAQGLIGGVASDYSMPGPGAGSGSTDKGSSGAYT